MFEREISSRAIDEVSGLNRAFLNLASSSPESGARYGLGAELVARLHLLEPEHCRRLATQPFSLFNIRLHEAAVWEPLLQDRVRDANSETPCWPGEGSSEHQFLLVALGVIRDMARRNPHRASVLFGLEARLAVSLPNVEISRLPAIAAAARPWLRAVLAADTAWWDSMIVSACRGSAGPAGRDLGIHRTLQRALNLRDARLPHGRLCRRR